MTVPKSGTGG